MQLSEEERRKFAAYYTLPFGFAAAVALFFGLGWVVDRWLGASPVFTVVGTFLGAAAGLYYLVRHALEMQRDRGADTDDNDGSSEPSSKAPDVR